MAKPRRLTEQMNVDLSQASAALTVGRELVDQLPASKQKTALITLFANAEGALANVRTALNQIAKAASEI